MIRIGEEELLLGESFDHVVQNSKHLQTFPPHGGWVNLRFACRSILGIPALLTEIRAPLHDRPVLQQSFELAAPIGQNSDEQLLEKVNMVLGSLLSLRHHETADPMRVRMTANWRFGACQATLSIYGGGRKIENGFSSAGLFFDVYNESILAQPYLIELARLERALWSRRKDFRILATFLMEKKNRPFGRAEFSTIEDPDQFLYRAKKALYKRSLLDTPDFVSDGMTEKMVKVWSANGNFFISTIHDTICFDPKIHPIQSFVLRPAKGSGSHTMVIDELTLQDTPDSQGLRSLINHLVSLGGTLTASEDYDA